MNIAFSQLVTRISNLQINKQSVRWGHHKHWLPKWKKLRGQKVIKIDLSRFEEAHKDFSEMSEETRRKKMKEKGLYPQAPWIEKPIYIGSTGSIFESYVPPEGDGKFSAVTPAGTKQNVEFLVKKGKSYQAIKKIKNYEEDFNVGEFPMQALDVYIKAHEALANKEHSDVLSTYVTEKAYTEMLFNTEHKQIIWKYIKSIDPARIVHARVTHILSETNYFAQVTVRFHTSQILAVYDRFGRLMSGSEILAKDVLEYVIFEKHLTNSYGKWRLHGKILPSWLPETACVNRTYHIQKPEDPATVKPIKDNRSKSEVNASLKPETEVKENVSATV